MASQMPQRSFTAQHMLQDAEQEFADAIYRFREAEKNMTGDYDSARCAMNDAEGKVATIRQHIYNGNYFKLWEKEASCQQYDRCPQPAWIQQAS